MNTPQFYSQAGQDRFVFEFLVKRGNFPLLDGRFLDIGGNHPIEWNNTYMLEQLGWTGIMVEREMQWVDMWLKHRSSKNDLLMTDAAEGLSYADFPIKRFDYISIDVEKDTLRVVRKILEAGITFSVATIEHNSYLYGALPRNLMRSMLKDRGYVLYAADVCNNGLAYEDWWVRSDLNDRVIDLSFTELAP